MQVRLERLVLSVRLWLVRTEFFDTGLALSVKQAMALEALFVSFSGLMVLGICLTGFVFLNGEAFAV